MLAYTARGLGGEMFTELRFGSRSKTFGNHRL